MLKKAATQKTTPATMKLFSIPVDQLDIVVGGVGIIIQPPKP